MPQQPLPAPLAPRPEPGVQLLEAVWQRHSQRSLQLAQQWVHRRGVLDLQRFCSTQLNSALGAEAVAWLQELLALDAPQAASGEKPASPTLAVPTETAVPLSTPAATDTPPLAEAEPATAAPQPEPELDWEAPAPAAATPAAPGLQTPESLDPMLHARAVAAVDEAFAALAQSFHDDSDSLVAPGAAISPAPLKGAPEATAVAEPGRIPPPLPVGSGLWPTLRASAASLGSALRPAGGRNRLTPELDPAHTAVPSPESPQSSDVLTPATAAAAAPLPTDALIVAEPLATNPDPLTGDQEAPAEVTAEASGTEQELSPPTDTDPAALPVETETQASPLQRLRGRIQSGRLPRLSRLRSVMRDCVDETLALLRTSDASPGSEVDGGADFALSQPPQPALPVQEQPSTSWSLDPFLAPSPVDGSAATQTGAQQRPIAGGEIPSAAPAAGATPGAPVSPPPAPFLTAEAAATPGPTTSAAASAPAASSLAAAKDTPTAPSQPLKGLAGRMPVPASDRPAPAPATLSDLRAWLPGRGDLPRAS